MSERDYYLTIEEKTSAEVKIDKSRFIGHCCPIESVDDALSELEKIRVEHYNATHNCWAYSIGGGGLEYRYSDDGEPNNTAGKPILFSIRKSGLSDILVVVTRYYGGKKLGKGGLIRAYSEAADLALALSKSKKVMLTETYEVFCTYEDINQIKRLLSEFAYKYEEEYTDSIRILAEIPLSSIKIFTDRVTQDTAARAGWKKYIAY